MKVCRVVWEDSEKKRDVELVVDYRVVEGGVQIDKITPAKVTLYEACGEQVKKVLPVTTKTGQMVLARAHQNSDHHAGIAQEILDQHLAV
jgi:hypothetical protein